MSENSGNHNNPKSTNNKNSSKPKLTPNEINKLTQSANLIKQRLRNGVPNASGYKKIFNMHWKENNPKHGLANYLAFYLGTTYRNWGGRQGQGDYSHTLHRNTTESQVNEYLQQYINGRRITPEERAKKSKEISNAHRARLAENKQKDIQRKKKRTYSHIANVLSRHNNLKSNYVNYNTTHENNHFYKLKKRRMLANPGLYINANKNAQNSLTTKNLFVVRNGKLVNLDGNAASEKSKYKFIEDYTYDLTNPSGAYNNKWIPAYGPALSPSQIVMWENARNRNQHYNIHSRTTINPKKPPNRVRNRIRVMRHNSRRDKGHSLPFHLHQVSQKVQNLGNHYAQKWSK